MFILIQIQLYITHKHNTSALLLALCSDKPYTALQHNMMMGMHAVEETLGNLMMYQYAAIWMMIDIACVMIVRTNEEEEL